MTGIGFFRATIDGHFALTDFDAKSGKIIYKMDEYTPHGKHIFKLSVSDKKQNFTTFEKEILF